MKQNLTIGLFQSLSYCGLRSKLIKNIAFQPPPVSYNLKLRQKTSKSMMVSSKELDYIDDRQKSKSYDDDLLVQFSQAVLQEVQHHSRIIDNQQFILQIFFFNLTREYPRHDFYLVDGDNAEIPIPQIDNTVIAGYYLKSRKGNKIASIYITDSDAMSDYVLLFSHGNASDLGFMIDTLIDLQNNLRVNVFAYEYTGYGMSTGKCSDLNTIKDIQISYEFLVQQLKFEPTKILVYGYSIGSGPSVTLVKIFLKLQIKKTSDPTYPVGGLIIHSGLTSGLRVMDKKIKNTPFYDIFPNIDRIKFVTCPIFILHGNCDEIIDLEHAQQLAKNSQRLYELWEVDQAGHGGIDTDEKHRITYFKKLRQFISFIKKENESIQELQERNKASPIHKQNHYYNSLKEFSLGVVGTNEKSNFCS